MMNARKPERRQNQPSFAKGVALIATGLVVTLGAGALLIGSRSGSTSGSTKTNASRPAWANEKTRTAHAAVRPNAPVTVAPATNPAAVAEAEPAVEPQPIRTTPVTWAEAQTAWDAGDWSGAAELYAGYVEEHPGNPWGHYMKGLALRQAGELEPAERALLDCIAIDPDHEKALVNLARVRVDLDRPADAREAAEHAVALDAENGAAQRVLARVLHTQGLRAQAEETYLAALAIDPDDAWSLNNLGLLRIEDERFEEAIAPLERACVVDAAQALFFNNLGVARERTRRYRAAEEAYAMAISADPSSPKAEVSLARVEALGGPVDEPVETTDEPVGVLAAAAPEEVMAGPSEVPEEDGRER